MNKDQHEWVISLLKKVYQHLDEYYMGQVELDELGMRSKLEICLDILDYDYAEKYFLKDQNIEEDTINE